MKENILCRIKMWKKKTFTIFFPSLNLRYFHIRIMNFFEKKNRQKHALFSIFLIFPIFRYFSKTCWDIIQDSLVWYILILDIPKLRHFQYLIWVRKLSTHFHDFHDQDLPWFYFSGDFMRTLMAFSFGKPVLMKRWERFS